MKLQDLSAYELLKQEMIPDIQSDGYLLRHKKSGARIMVLANDDENKVFHITFRTPPADSTGVAHILEHCTLCGSEKFPSKDPFVELVKGSLNTFLNAMTYPDKTMFPVASCNDADFANLMDVYLDAVFHTNIYKNECIFRQEGWNYHLENKEDEITYNGVVYNEMKGAFSSPEDVLDREILNAMYPDTPYGFESGGDPEDIPNLTYEQFLDFHRTYYHPSNSYIYLYGNLDAAERLQWLDKEYLSKYDKIDVDSEIKVQPAFDAPREIYKKYSISASEEEQDNTYLSWNAAIGLSTDVEMAEAFAVIEYALLSAPGAPLKQALLDAQVGKDIMGSYDSGTRQPNFSVIAKNANLEDKEKFLQIIQKVLKQIVADGMDEKALLAGINYMEFRFREADFGSYPKGLMYGIDAMDSWLYDENSPFDYLKLLPVFQSLKEKVGTGYYEDLIQKYMLDNTHIAVVIVEPEKGLTAKMDEACAKKLADWKATLSDAQLEELIENTQKLQEFQETLSTPEELAKIPMLSREDIEKKAPKLYNTPLKYDDIEVLWHEVPTNGIAYQELLFDLKYVEKDDLPYLGILKSALGMMDTEHYSYGELFNEINMQTGGISCGLQLFQNCEKENEIRTMFGVRSKALYEKTSFVYDMIQEILFHTKLTDEKRLYEIVAEQKSRVQMRLNSSGHSTAVIRAMSYFSNGAAFNDLTGGIAYYKMIEDLEKNFEEKKADLIARLQKLMGQIFRKDTLFVSITAEKRGMTELETQVKRLQELLSDEKTAVQKYELVMGRKNEGFQTSAKVQYVTRAGNYKEEGYEYTGALRILKVILSYEYLWVNVRVKGGAYGCMSAFGRTGDSYFASYRDPNLEKTNEVYEGVPDYVASFEVDERDMTKYVIGTISELDTPLTASAKGARSLNSYMNHITEADMQRERDQILGATKEDIRALAPLMRAILKDNNLCVLGNEEHLAEAKEMFLSLNYL